MKTKKSFAFPVLCLVLLLQSSFHPAYCNIFPANGSVLTQVHIMFECDDIEGADTYEISIYRIPQNGRNSIGEKVISVTTRNLTVLVREGLLFGNDYRWKFKAFKKQQLIFTGKWNNFTILKSAQVIKDSFKTEINFTGNPGSDVIFLDHSAMAIDKKGNPVWFLDVNTDSISKLIIRDLKLNSAGTITHLDIYGAYEKNLQGKIIWKGSDDGKVSGAVKEEYHHDLKRNNDGSHTVCGSFYATAQKNKKVSDASAIRYNTLIDYDADNSIRWSWNEYTSMQTDSLFIQFRTNKMGGHLNGFAFTNDRSKVFMSFKNLSDVFLYDIPAGKFVTSLKQTRQPDPFNFQQQHGPYLNKNNELIIYNNNIVEKEETEADAPLHPSVLIFRYDTINNTFLPVWQYQLRSEKFPQGIMGKEGYVSETNKGNLLVCAGGNNYAAEINRDKEKIWECYFYKRAKADTAWKPYSNYRCQSATSLYPLYFTLQYTGHTKDDYTFTLCNAGSEPGIFELVFSGTDSKTIVKQLSKELMPGESQLIKLKTRLLNNKKIKCRISPLHVSGIYKDYYYQHLR